MRAGRPKAGGGRREAGGGRQEAGERRGSSPAKNAPGSELRPQRCHLGPVPNETLDISPQPIATARHHPQLQQTHHCFRRPKSHKQKRTIRNESDVYTKNNKTNKRVGYAYNIWHHFSEERIRDGTGGEAHFCSCPNVFPDAGV